MLFDWFTVGAQAVNFVILLWLMKRFLYKPILHAIDEREKRIAAELANADANMAKAHTQREEFQHKNQAFEKKRTEMMDKARDEVKAERERLLEEARLVAEELRIKREEAQQKDALSLHQAIQDQTLHEVFAISRRVLKDLATTSLEGRISEVFTQRLQDLNSDTKTQLTEALEQSTNNATLRSAFDLPTEAREAIQHAVNVAFSADIHLAFETNPALISGIEFTAAGRKVAWSIAEYLESMESGIQTLLQKQQGAEVTPNPQPPLDPPQEQP